jgi:hypothetical protein
MSTWKETKVFLTRYLEIYILVAVFMFFGLKWHKNKNYSTEKLEEMMVSVSDLRDKTDDPCKYSILGDPVAAKFDYIKVFIFCGDGTKSTNSMDLRAVKEKTVIGALRELGRVNGFEVKYEDNRLFLGKYSSPDLKCFQNQKFVNDFGTDIKVSGTIECYYNFLPKEIAVFYEK